MPDAVWKKAITNSPDKIRSEHYYKQLSQTAASSFLASASDDQARILVQLFSGSEALSELLLIHPDWIEQLTPESLSYPRKIQGLKREVDEWLVPSLNSKDFENGFRQIRMLKQREMLRIAARDLAHMAPVPEIIKEISNIADISLETVHRICWEQLTGRFGEPWHRESDGPWQKTKFCVLGMGKLGGQELNYSSDVDVLFVYSGEGFAFKTPPKKNDQGRGLANHHFFKQLAEQFINEVSRLAPEGALFRIDLRLRPEGKSSPLARSLGSYENYYSQWGQTWERMMLIKARCIAGDSNLAGEFLEMVQPFRYPRTITDQLPHEVAEMKLRIENEVIKAGELERNVKLGRGGIREIEFIVQTLQVLHGGRYPFLQSTQTLPTLSKLVQYELLGSEEAAKLSEAYCFLRAVEHRLQMNNNRQTHTVPADRVYQERLARLMQFGSLAAFQKKLHEVNDTVRSSYDRFIKMDPNKPGNALPYGFEENEAAWIQLLESHSFIEPQRSLKILQEFVNGPGFGHVSSRTSQSARELITRFFSMCRKKGEKAPNELFLSDPDRVLARVASFVSAYGARAVLYETWLSNPSLFKLLLVLFDRSEFLAELAIRTPDLVDEIEQTGQLRRHKSSIINLEELRHGMDDPDQHFWVRRYFQAELMRIGLRDILDLANPEETQSELTSLADACLTYATEVIVKKHGFRKPPFAIFGLGKLGGQELIYGSDLDIFFVAPPKVQNLPALQKVAIDIMDLLTRRTEHGTTFETDARLRPDGLKGLLVNTVDAYQEYYRKRAMLWEIQSLTRLRPITGHAEVLQQMLKQAEELTRWAKGRNELSAYIPNWREEVHLMRLRIQTERTPAGMDKLAIKTGIGGLVDVEFIAQVLSLASDWHEPNTLRALKKAAECGLIETNDAALLSEHYKQLMQVERILRRWSLEAESLLPNDPAPLYRVAARCGHPTSDAFLAEVNRSRNIIRSIYNKVFAVENVRADKGPAKSNRSHGKSSVSPRKQNEGLRPLPDHP
ncbi:MAG: bifunctional [glutamate--ammonia ligase]-adenylyl-L-tyrosine phosphorylase/[glutamate--ammonia-ligase] adenylyltransferase [Verrucomicrobiota bacterium]|nr:bifunctional [glutamate--ammonia ligase]-adenylyl-L-tyrosine phosphorylase/[glutamate--ammonia-ligase] adenylyltransferase [Verrucomicrobiota bacterium]